MLKQEAQKQLEPITIAQIKESLKIAIPEKFAKMIIDDSQKVKRCNYVFTKLKYEKVERLTRVLRFPVYQPVKKLFTEFEGGRGKFGEKASIASEKLFDTLKTKYDILDEKFETRNHSDSFKYPLDEVNGEISKNQKKYFFSDLTYQETCKECKGEQYIQCNDSECHGRHNWTCTNCKGDGKITCMSCEGEKKIVCKSCVGDGKVTCKNCKGKGNLKCGAGAGSFIGRNVLSSDNGVRFGGCGGTGKVKDTNHSKGYRKCKSCRGKGEISCEDCSKKGVIKCDNCSGKGKVNCSTCSAKGKVNCSTCSSKGDITCKKCYGDKKKYGKIDCPECKTAGAIGQVVFVQSLFSQNENKKIIQIGDKLSISEDVISKHVASTQNLELVFKKVNESYDEYSKEYADLHETELGLSKNSFPLVIKEEMYYQVVPCIELSYRHMLTNTNHEFTIANIWDNPEIIFHSEPEQLSQGAGNILKSIKGFFSKLFRTKAYKLKEDKKNEIILLIYLAKADGEIGEEEKISLPETIGHLDNFTNSEKQQLFDLISTPSLPQLTEKEIVFSTHERAEQVLKRLTELAMADGEIERSEKAFIDHVRKLIG